VTDVVLDPRDLGSPFEASPCVDKAPPAAAIPPSRNLERFEFTGSAREYFGIWVVNLFLTIVTLGIYSAWAKVRKKRYFYGNTWVAGANFEYHGNPVAILKGRVIAFAAFLAYTLAGGLSPRGGAYVLLALSPLVPWFVVRSMSFNAANTSYRNLRFHFDGRYREALAALAPFILVPIAGLLLPEPDMPPEDVAAWWPYFVTPLVLGAFYPYVMGSLKRLHINRSRYGDASFECAATISAFYRVYFLAFLVMVVLGATLSFVAMPLFFWLPEWGWSAYPAIYMLEAAVLFAFTQARVTNLALGETALRGDVRLSSTLSARRLAILYIQNLFAIAATLGLAIPWAVVRTARYRCECLALDCEGGLNTYMAQARRSVGATGDSFGDMFDVDLSL
jgi:uncharacterized membrane protein YjgN (DUF898 family)